MAAPHSPNDDLSPEGALHDISNSLTVALGWIALALERTTDAVTREALEIARAKTIEAMRISRRSIGATTETMPDRTVANVLRHLAIDWDLEARRRHVTLTVHASDSASDHIVIASEVATQVLSNLVSNALHASPEGSRVRLEADQTRTPNADERVVFWVRDDGKGIAPSAVSMLFERGGSTKEGGAGIGLWNASVLARRSGGHLQHEPTESGAAFSLSWPVRSGQPAAATQPMPAGNIASLSVLIIEDDEAVIDLLDMVLSARGAKPVCVRSIADLDVALQLEPFDRVLADLSPMGEHPEEVLQRVRATLPNAKVIVMSGRETALPKGVSFLRKPFEIDDVIRALGGPPRVGHHA